MLFLELMQVTIGRKRNLSRIPSQEEWNEIFSMCQKQSVVGVSFLALEKLTAQGQKPPLNILLEWIGQVEQIKARNILLNKRCIDVSRYFKNAGFDNCILKGQSNALMYPDPLLRTPGDIDIWIRGNRNEIINFCNSNVCGCIEWDHHIQFPKWNDVEVEVHFIPSFSIVPRYEKCLQAFFEPFRCIEIYDEEYLSKDAKVYTLTKEMNLVFQISHIARHFFMGGVGLRQLMDYYYLLKSEGLWNKDDVIGTLRDLGLYKFAGAVMWVLKEALAAEEKMLIVPVDEKRGELLLDEIMKGGNFGQYNQCVSGRIRKKSTTMSIVIKNLRILRFFPEEVMWTPMMFVRNYLKY